MKFKTGIKACMNEDEVFYIYIRSSIGYKYNVTLANNVGVIDSDFYNNPENEGHFSVKLINHGDKDLEININDRIAQGIFMKYLLTEDDEKSEKVLRDDDDQYLKRRFLCTILLFRLPSLMIQLLLVTL